MPRQADPDLEQRILKAADALWRRGGAKALTMRAVARAAATNTPAVYRRFKNRQDLVRGILMRTASRIRQHFEKGGTIEGMCDAYVEFALAHPHEYQLFFTEARLLDPPTKRGAPTPPIRQSRSTFAFAEQVVAQQMGGSPEDCTRFTLAVWCTLHGAASLLISKSLPLGHDEELRAACRAGIRALIQGAPQTFRQN